MSGTVSTIVRDRPGACRLVSWTPWARPGSTLIGHCDVTFAGGWRINGVPVFKLKTGGLSVGAPTAPQLDRNGQARTDADGKRLYSPLLQFEGDAARERWNRSILGALADAGINPDRAAQQSLPLNESEAVRS